MPAAFFLGSFILALPACEPTANQNQAPDHVHEHMHHGPAGSPKASHENDNLAAAHVIASAPADRLSVQAARVRAVPPGVRVSAAYMRIVNRTANPDRLLAVRMAGAARVEIHETVVDEEGVMRMRPLAKGIAIPAGSGVELKPGGAHVMLMELGVEPRAGQSVELECEFERGGTITVSARVFNGES
ncbi:MAG: copper chaperone PCu(A)C [Leptospirales bacterium]